MLRLPRLSALAFALAPPLAALALLPAALAHEFTAGALEIGHPYAIETSAGVRSGAGYLSIANTGAEPDRLIAVRADFPKVEIHAAETDAAGVARMTPVEAVEIPPGATVELAPRGLHVMFMGLSEPLKAGGRFPATLVFEKAGEAPVEFVIEPRKGAGAPVMDHGAMDHGEMDHGQPDH